MEEVHSCMEGPEVPLAALLTAACVPIVAKPSAVEFKCLRTAVHLRSQSRREENMRGPSKISHMPRVLILPFASASCMTGRLSPTTRKPLGLPTRRRTNARPARSPKAWACMLHERLGTARVTCAMQSFRPLYVYWSPECSSRSHGTGAISEQCGIE